MNRPHGIHACGTGPYACDRHCLGRGRRSSRSGSSSDIGRCYGGRTEVVPEDANELLSPLIVTLVVLAAVQLNVQLCPNERAVGEAFRLIVGGDGRTVLPPTSATTTRHKEAKQGNAPPMPIGGEYQF